ncbi:MAG TPA: DUF1624 domain-containing protein [Clostridiales bacterium]|nr:DUF1624 domain-containing protein [Clostridiales bacterium]
MNLTDEQKAMKRQQRKEKIKNRAWEVDALRGLAILLVLWDHFMFDAAFVFETTFIDSGNQALINFTDFASSYYYGDLRLYARPIFIFIFFFVSGICIIFSRNNIIRGIKLLAVAYTVTLLTYLAEIVFQTTGLFILMGVLHCLGFCILIGGTIDALLNLILKDKSYAKWVKFAIYGVLAIVILVINHFYNTTLFQTSDIFTSHNNDASGFFVFSNNWAGLTNDYFPLLPFLGFFFIGASVAQVLYSKKKSLFPNVNQKIFAPLTVPGRYSLIIYLLAQIVFFFVLGMVSLALTGTLGFM